MGTDDAPVPEYAADYSPAPDDAPDASHLTPEEKRGPRTVHVALGLLAFLLIVAVATNPASVLPRDSTLHGEHHLDVDSGLELSVPVGWRVVSDAELGSLQIVPVGTGHALETRILHRAIYAVPVYEAGLQLSGRFDTGAVADVLPDGGEIRWNEARMIYAVSDLRGIGEDVRFSLSGGRNLRFEPNSDFDRPGSDGAAWRGMSAPVAGLQSGAAFDFEGSLQISGARRFALLASGRETTADIVSDWPHPGFDGQYLPDSREIGAEGFSASWRVPYLARGVPAGSELEYVDLGTIAHALVDRR